MTHEVFICHSSKDRTIATAICSTLEQHHIRCWIAPRDVLPGTDYGGAITEAISSTRITVLVFSRNSNDSPHVRREIERTISHGIPVLPFRVEDIVPSPALEYFISDAHWLDAMTPPLEQHLDHLVGTVRLLLEREVATPADGPAASAPAGPEAVAVARAPVVLGSSANLPHRRPSNAVLAAVGAATVVVLAGAAFVLGGGGRPGASQIAGLPSSSPTATVLASATATPGSGPTAEPTQDAAAAKLASALPAAVSCDPPDVASPGDVEAASVFCYVGDGTVGSVVYTLYPTVDALRNDYGAWLDYYKLALGTSGSCAKGDQMEDTWSFESTPSTVEGHYFCVVDDEKVADLYWTDEASLILVDITGDTDVALDKLYPVWRTNKYDPVRP